MGIRELFPIRFFGRPEKTEGDFSPRVEPIKEEPLIIEPEPLVVIVEEPRRKPAPD